MDVNATLAAAATPAKAPAQPTAEQRTARDFEAVFLSQMMQLMMGTVEQEGGFDGGHGEDMFRGMLAEKMGNAIAQKGGIGLAPRVMDEIIRLQGGAKGVD